MKAMSKCDVGTITAVPPDPDWAVRSVACPLGRQGVVNEDSYVLIGPDGVARWLDGGEEHKHQHPAWPVGHIRLAVLDGVGGHGRGGEISAWVAARLAMMPAFESQGLMCAALDNLHHQARAAFALTKPGCAPGTTLLVLEIPLSGPAWMYHVGDSRLWLERGEGMELLTVDHCPSTARALRGELSFSAWQNEVLHQYHRPICQAFGLGSSLLKADLLCPDLTPLDSNILPLPLRELGDRRSISIPRGGIVMLATDGLWCFQQPMKFLMFLDKALSEQTACMEVFADQVLAAHRDASMGNTRCDNTTMILCRLQ